MPPYPAFLSRVLRLQIRDRNLCCCGTIAARAFRPAGKCRGLFEVLALRWLQIPPEDIESRRCRYDDTCTHRKHTAVVRTPARRIRTTVVVGRPYQSRKHSGVTETPYNFQYAPRCRKTSRKT